MIKRFLTIAAIAIVFSMVLSIAIPALANAEPETLPWNEGFGFHCDAVKGNGRTDVTINDKLYRSNNQNDNGKDKAMHSTLVRVGNTTTWELKTHDIVCGTCGRIDWVTYSNNNGKINGKNIQAQHSNEAVRGCTFDKVIDEKPADCVEAGFIVKECKCGKTERTVFEKLGHTSDDAEWYKTGTKGEFVPCGHECKDNYVCAGKDCDSITCDEPVCGHLSCKVGKVITFFAKDCAREGCEYDSGKKLEKKFEVEKRTCTPECTVSCDCKQCACEEEEIYTIDHFIPIDDDRYIRNRAGHIANWKEWAIYGAFGSNNDTAHGGRGYIELIGEFEEVTIRLIKIGVEVTIDSDGKSSHPQYIHFANVEGVHVYDKNPGAKGVVFYFNDSIDGGGPGMYLVSITTRASAPVEPQGEIAPTSAPLFGGFSSFAPTSVNLNTETEEETEEEETEEEIEEEETEEEIEEEETEEEEIEEEEIEEEEIEEEETETTEEVTE